ncbi:MAG: hypothetical protein ACP5HG_17390 [Anaerolineae bacterium]
MTISGLALLMLAIGLTVVVAVLILIYLLTRNPPAPGVEDAVEMTPLETRAMARLRSIDNKLTAVNIVAILTLIGWLLTCIVVALSLAFGESVVSRFIPRWFRGW